MNFKNQVAVKKTLNIIINYDILNSIRIQYFKVRLLKNERERNVLLEKDKVRKIINK